MESKHTDVWWCKLFLCTGIAIGMLFGMVYGYYLATRYSPSLNTPTQVQVKSAPSGTPTPYLGQPASLL